MQTVIYADILIVVNSIVTFFVLLSTSDIVRICCRKIRILTGSVIGGLFSLIIVAPPMNLFFVFLTRIIMCLIIVLISFPVKRIRSILKCMAGFSLISFLYAGIVYFLSGLINSNRIIYNNGYGYFDLSAISLVGIIVIIFFAVKLVNKKLMSSHKKDYIFDTEIEFRKNKYHIKALFDSGNNVRDSYSGKPVIIVSFSEVETAFSEEDKKTVKDILSGNYSGVVMGMRLIPVKTLGEQKLLPAVSAERLTVKDEFSLITIDEPCIAFSSDSFGGKEYGALINDSVLKKVI